MKDRYIKVFTTCEDRFSKILREIRIVEKRIVVKKTIYYINIGSERMTIKKEEKAKYESMGCKVHIIIK